MLDRTPREMILVAFLQAQNCSNLPSSWRHPATSADFMTPQYYQRIGRTLEDGRFDLAFFDDRLAMPDIFGDDYRAAVRHGIRTVKLDPTTVASAMGATTSRLGLGATYSTTYYEPFHVARLFATLDLMLGGRAAWNVVTSLNDSEAANFGLTEQIDHDLRYDRANEFMEVVLGHWDTWDEDAILFDREKAIFADPDKVRRLDHAGRWFRSRGPFTVPRSPQGHPVIIQAGQSGRGRTFAARWAELVFSLFPTIEFGRNYYRDFKEQVAALGRDPQHVKLAPAIYVVVAETRSMAEQKAEHIERLAQPIDTLALLSEVLNFDFARKAPDEPFSEAELASISGLQTMRDRVIAASGKDNPTVTDFVQFSRRGTLRELPLFVGTPLEVANELEAWFVGEACDGFVLAATHVPGAYEDFARLVVPELQRRGLVKREYLGPTLRQNLRLPRGVIGEGRSFAE